MSIVGAAAAALFGMSAGAADGTVAVAAAADTVMSATTTGPSGAYTTVSTITMSETAPGVVIPGSVVVAAPAGFELGPGPVHVSDGGASVDGLGLSPTDDCAAPADDVDVLASAATVAFYVCGATTTTVAQLSIDGITVRPTQATPLGNGDLHIDAASTAGLPGIGTGPTGTSLGHLVETAGPATAIVATASAGNATAGDMITVVVEARDGYGNVADGYAGTVRLTSNDDTASMPPSHAFDAIDRGRYTFTGVVLRHAGATTVVASDVTSSAVDPGLTDVAVAPGPAASLDVTGGGETTAGVTTSLAVRAQDAFGNTATDYVGTVHLAASDASATVPADYAFTPTDAGAHTFTDLVFRTAGAQAVTAADGTTGITGSQSSFVVIAGPARRLDIGNVPDTVVAGTALAPTLTATDDFGNRATTYRGTVALDVTDLFASVPADITFTAADAGVRDLPGTVLRSAGWHVLTATDTNDPTLVATRSGIVVVPAPTARLTIEMSTASAAGQPLTTAVRASDAFGNPTPDYDGTVALTTDDSLAALPAPHAFTAGDLGAWLTEVRFGIAGVHTVTATDITAGITAEGPAVTVTHGIAFNLDLTVSPSMLTADGASLAAALATITDAFGNRVPDSSILVMSDGDVTVGPATSNGDGTYVALVRASTTTGVETLTATDGAISDTTTLLERSGPPTTLSVEAQPASTRVVVGQRVPIAVTARDAFDNVVTDYAGTVHVTSSDPLATTAADHAFTPPDAGTFTFTSGVSFATPGLQTVTVTDTADAALIGQTAPIKVVLDTLLTVTTSGSAVAFPSITLDGNRQGVDAALDAVRIVDNRVVAAGWSVTATMSDLTVGGDAHATGNRRIPAGNLTWDPAANAGCHAVDGDGDGVVDGTAGDVASGPGGLASDAGGGVALDPLVPASLCVATPGGGLGAFDVRPDVRLRVPASAAAGTYRGVLTITIS
jgi:hypothetical protein